jgi:hypothetical protein
MHRLFDEPRVARKIIWEFTIAMFASQLIINLVILYLFALRGR